MTHEANRAFYERTWARPHTIQQDLLAKEPKQPMFETMTDKKVMTDGRRRSSSIMSKAAAITRE